MLFNETIRSNIKFGDLSASDARVIEVAVQANALAFIMQNDEDYTTPQVKSRVTEDFNKIINEQQYSQYKKIGSLLDLANQGKIDFRHLMFVNMMLPFLTTSGLEMIESSFEYLISALLQ